MMEYKSFKLDVQEVTGEGRIIGALAVYNNRDRHDDVVRPGAFDKTLAEKKGVFPALWQHDWFSPVGVNLVSDSDAQLGTEVVLNLEKQLGRDAYSDVKHWQQHGLQFGLSIGFNTIKDRESKSGLRELLEIELMEGSLVTFPANDYARVTSVKGLNAIMEEFKAGRMLSAANVEALRTAISDGESAILRLRTLLEAAEGAEKGAVHTSDEPERLHSFLTQFRTNLRGETVNV